MTRNRFDKRPSFRFLRSGVFVLAAMIATAGVSRAQTGKISAKILDAKTGEPLLKASVQILQTRAGAYTKENGIATIIGVPPEGRLHRRSKIYRVQSGHDFSCEDSVRYYDFAKL